MFVLLCATGACAAAFVVARCLALATFPRLGALLLSRVRERQRRSGEVGATGQARLTSVPPALSSVLTRRQIAAGSSLLDAGLPEAAAPGVVSLCATAFGGGAAYMVGVVVAISCTGMSSRTELAAKELLNTLVASAIWLTMWGALLVAVVCDMGERVIPKETCAFLGLAGAVTQGVSQGLGSLAWGACFGLALMAGCRMVNRWGRFHRQAPMVGGGDVRCMVALSIASGRAAPLGCAACFACAALVALVGCASGKMNRREAMPLAPFFCLWLWVGAGSALVC